jgi:alkylation response protein AidB-like acyl-CoA dehydrogenase
MHQIIFNQEESRVDVATGAFDITLGMIAPTILTHGTDEQRQHVPRMLRGDELWCQLFSEPAAGSDLAGLRTSAVRDGDEWVVNGQKVWTSGAHYADWGYLLARTDPSVPKHRGLTAFILPMDTPGITVRPLRQMTGGANFNEVFFEDVRVPDSQRLGAEGSGWHVALTTLMNERFSVGDMRGAADIVTALKDLARDRGIHADPVARQALARLYTYAEVLRYTSYRSLTALSRGAVPGPEGSVAKLAATRLLRAGAELAAVLNGPYATLAGEWASLVCGTPGLRIAGGTDEVMRNIIGERVLALPAEPRIDKDVAFAAAPTVPAGSPVQQASRPGR